MTRCGGTHTLVTPAVGRLMQREGCEFKVSMGDITQFKASLNYTVKTLSQILKVIASSDNRRRLSIMKFSSIQACDLWLSELIEIHSNTILKHTILPSCLH